LRIKEDHPISNMFKGGIPLLSMHLLSTIEASILKGNSRLGRQTDE